MIETIRPPSLSPAEALALHHAALVIDSQQPFITTGAVFTPAMRDELAAQHAAGRTTKEAAAALSRVLAREIASDPTVAATYRDVWRTSGVTAACGTFSALEKLSTAFEAAVQGIADAQGIIAALPDDLRLIRRTADLDDAHAAGQHGVIIDFQNTLAIADELDRIDLFHGLALRMVQLTYNLQNLVGDGCTERYQGGLTYFGQAFVARLNERRILVDVSHSSEQVGRDAMACSTAPVIVSHSCSKAVTPHDRGKSDDFARAIAEQGGYFGVVVVPGFIRDSPGATMADVVRHVVHLVDVCGIDHVGIGTDKGGPGPATGTVIDYPADMPYDLPGEFSWSGFRDAEHRLTPEYAIADFQRFEDWPNVTVALAAAGFTEDELRKLLGLNFRRVFQEVVG